jgi:hypothetical protein
MRIRIAAPIALISSLLLLAGTEVFAGNSLYEGAWIAESFGNDKVGIGTEASQYFEALGIPLGANCHSAVPLCDFASTPATTTGTEYAPGATGTVWAPLGPGCRLLLSGELPRPAKGGTSPPRVPPLYRNKAFFTAGGAASNQLCGATTTVGGSPATVYLAPHDPLRGIGQNGAPVAGSGSATTTGSSFKFPAAGASPAPGAGMFRTANGSFAGDGPYLYSYTYAQLRNDAGSFGAGKGFFSTAAATNTVTFLGKAGGTTVRTAKITAGTNRFGGVMQLLGSYTTKVCYFYGGGCGLGYGTWAYELIGASGFKDSKAGSPVVTAPATTSFSFTYYNTALASIAKYDLVASRFPWTTGTVTVQATKRGQNKTFEQRKGFDTLSTVTNGSTKKYYRNVQLVSPILTQWLAQAASAPKFETGGIGVLNFRFVAVPEPGVIAGLVAGLSLLAVLHRRRR